MNGINDKILNLIHTNLSQEAQETAKDLYKSVNNSDRINFTSPDALTSFRKMMDNILKGLLEKIKIDYTLERTVIEGIQAHWISTPTVHRDDHVIIYLHGGCYVSGHSETYITIPIQLSHKSKMKVLVVDYSLAPEAPFPKGLNDVVRVYNYLCNNGYSPNNIGIIGDSAGGGLALAMLLRLKETNSELPAAIGLLSPWGDLNLNGDTMTTLAGVDPILSKEQLSAFAKLYVQKEDANHHLVSPVYGDYKGFPPMMIITGSREILLSDTIRIAQNAIKNQVEISLEIYEGLWHVFCADPSLPESNDALEKLASFFTKYLM